MVDLEPLGPFRLGIEAVQVRLLGERTVSTFAYRCLSASVSTEPSTRSSAYSRMV